MATENEKALNEATAAITLQVSQKNLETAKLAHRKMVEQLSMRTATIAQMAATILTAPTFYNSKLFTNNNVTPAGVAVKLAEEIMVEAELSAAKAKELADTLNG